MPAGNVARLGIALQTARGAPATAPQYWLNMTGGAMRPTPETEQRSETGLGRDVGDTYIRVLSASGDPAVLLRPDTAPLILYGVLGGKAKVGTADPVTHTLTGANDQPWMTVWKEQGDALFERYEDCKITTCNIEFAAGGDIAASLNIFGLGFKRLTPAEGAAAAAAGVHDQAVPFRVPGAKYTIAGSDDKTLASGNFNIEATQNPIQTTEINYSYLIPGQRTITFGYEGVFVDVSRYAQVYYGAPAGVDPALTVFEAPIKLQWGLGDPATPTVGQRILELSLTRALFTEAAPSMDPGGAPMMISVAGAAGRATPIVQARVVNGVVDYAPGGALLAA